MKRQQSQQQQHKPLAPRTAPLPSAQYPPQYSQQTPAIFRSVNLRRGKWTAEEEDYAEFVIREFEKGTLKECENGTTLRAFLSKKLHCAPMRISKKYAGKSIGKLVFLSRTNIPEDTFAEVETKRRELELKFYKSLYDEMRDGSRPHIGVNGYRYASIPNVAQQLIIPPMSMVPHSAAGTFLSQPVMMSSTGTTISHPAAQQQQRQHAVPLIGATQPLQNAQPPPPPPPPQQQQQGKATPTCTPSSVGAQPLQRRVAMPPNVASQPTSMAPSVSAPSAHRTKQLQQTYFNALNQMTAKGQPSFIPPPTTTDATGNKSPPSAAEIPSIPVARNAVQVSSKNASTSVPATSEDPDFLSGFEKVCGDDQRPPWMMPGTPLFAAELQCSPPLTSKSFDDLHQILGAGTDVYPKPFDLDAGKSDNSSQQQLQQQNHSSNSMPTTQQQHGSPGNGPADQRQCSADIYAAFAQQSALAVSQHSAYCRGDKATPNGNGVHVVAPAEASLDLSSSLAAMYGGQDASVVSQANLRAHSLSTQPQQLKPQPVASLKEKPQSSFPVPTRNIVSGSERSSEVGSTEDVGSMHGSSTSSNNVSSDTTSNDSDSNSDDGPPPRKRTKTGEDLVHKNAREGESPVSFDRCPRRSQ